MAEAGGSEMRSPATLAARKRTTRPKSQTRSRPTREDEEVQPGQHKKGEGFKRQEDGKGKEGQRRGIGQELGFDGVGNLRCPENLGVGEA